MVSYRSTSFNGSNICLVGKLSKTTLKKGETAEVSVQIKESSVTGTYAKSIYIETSNPQLRFLRLTLKGEAIPLLKVQPDSLLYIGNVQSGKEHWYATSEAHL